MSDSIEKIRTAFFRVHEMATGKTRQSYMSVPVDDEHDADCILLRAINELESFRDFVERRAKPSLIGCICPCHEEAAELVSGLGATHAS